MSSIRKRANGYSVLWREDGRQRSQMFPTRREAERFTVSLKRGTADTSRDATKAAMPFGQFVVEQYLPNARLSPNTKRDTVWVLNSQLPALRDRPLSWVASHRAEVQAIISASTRADHGLLYATVKRACDEAVNLGWIPSHRLAGMTVKRSTKRREIIPTTPEQRKAFADGLGAHGLAVWLMHGTGMRAGECLGLYGSDFRDGFATVRVQRQAQHGRRRGVILGLGQVKRAGTQAAALPGPAGMPA
jgi:integrase